MAGVKACDGLSLITLKPINFVFCNLGLSNGKLFPCVDTWRMLNGWEIGKPHVFNRYKPEIHSSMYQNDRG